MARLARPEEGAGGAPGEFSDIIKCRSGKLPPGVPHTGFPTRCAVCCEPVVVVLVVVVVVVRWSR